MIRSSFALRMLNFANVWLEINVLVKYCVPSGRPFSDSLKLYCGVGICAANSPLQTLIRTSSLSVVQVGKMGEVRVSTPQVCHRHTWHVFSMVASSCGWCDALTKRAYARSRVISHGLMGLNPHAMQVFKRLPVVPHAPEEQPSPAASSRDVGHMQCKGNTFV